MMEGKMIKRNTRSTRKKRTTIKWKVGNVNHEISLYPNGAMRLDAYDECWDRREGIDVPKRLFKQLILLMEGK